MIDDQIPDKNKKTTDGRPLFINTTDPRTIKMDVLDVHGLRGDRRVEKRKNV